MKPAHSKQGASVGKKPLTPPAAWNRTRNVIAGSGERYKSLDDLAPPAFITLSDEGVIREINLPAVHSFDRQKMPGEPFEKYIAKKDRKKFRDHLRRDRRQSQASSPLSVELQLAEEGEKTPAFIELCTVPANENPSGHTVYKGFFRDITRLKQMQEVHSWLAAIVQSSDDAIVGVDRKGKIISCNKGACELYGYAPDELIGKPVTILTVAEERGKKLEILRRALHGETIEHYETVHEHKNGQPIDVSLTISPIRDVGGKIIGASKIARDVTERRRSEKALMESLSRERLANQSKDHFLAALSHELRTPLNPVLLLASDLATAPDVPPELREHFDTIRKNIELEARLIDDLLDLTRITRGKLTLNQSEVDVHCVLNDAVSTVLCDVDMKQILLRLNLQAIRHKVFGDPVRLQQIFWNVLKNAVKFTPEGGEVNIATQTLPNNKIAVTFTDTGIGMRPEEIAHVFNAFSQGAHHFGGLGLGLAISRTLVELHRGSISASSPGKGKGATFIIELPLIPFSAAQKTACPEARALGIATRPHGEWPRRTHVLLVEDHEPTRMALARLLRDREYRVASAASFSEAQSLMEKNDDFQLLISDIGLPDGNGYNLMIQFRKKFQGGGIALTGFGREQDVARAQAAGFTTHLTKPVCVTSLDHAIAVALKTGRSNLTPVAKADFSLRPIAGDAGDVNVIGQVAQQSRDRGGAREPDAGDVNVTGQVALQLRLPRVTCAPDFHQP
ncbi:MAG TPA: PAS domain S-box protein [Alphaproteobacteria bacterium]|nr:PAS domain S-box protein [Alphaproteobacteria bacterium]